MQLPEIADYTVNVSYAAMIGPDDEIEAWRPVYWELRNSAQGEHLVDAIWDNGAWWQLVPDPNHPLLGPHSRNERVQMTRSLLLRIGLPEPLVQELNRRVCL